jgi:uncharacterized protein
MPILIDCYNVLHAEKPASLAGLGEASLCGLLAQSPWASGGVTVVCDGMPKPHSPAAREVEPVTLIFSGQGRSADDVIIGLIDADSAPRRLTVVSSDRTIRRAARRRRARDVSSEVFLEKLAQAMKRGGGGATAPGKPSTGPLTDDHIDRWLDWFGIPPHEQADESPEDPEDEFKKYGF